RELRRVNWRVVGMSLDADARSQPLQCCGDAINGSQCLRVDHCRPRIEKSRFSQTDGQSTGIFRDMNIAVRYFTFEDGLELCLHVAEPDCPTATRPVKTSVCVPDGVVIGGQTTRIVKRNNLPRRGKYGHPLESSLNSFGDLACFFLIRVRCSK